MVTMLNDFFKFIKFLIGLIIFTVIVFVVIILIVAWYLAEHGIL